MPRQRKTRQARRSPEEWARLISEQAESGLSQRAFCRSRALSVSTFCNAKRRAGFTARDTASGPGGDFVPVIVGTGIKGSEPTTQCWDIELSLGSGVVLRIRSV